MPKVSEIARVVPLGKSRKDVRERQHHVIRLLAENGAMKAADLAHELGYPTTTGAFGILNKLLNDRKIAHTGHYYHLRGQSALPKGVSELDKAMFFEGTSLTHRLRRYIREHQDEPMTVADMARAAGYAADSGASIALHGMIDKAVVRRYRAPEDRGFTWRYQYIDPALSGITVSPGFEPKPDATPEPEADTDADWHQAEIKTADPVDFETKEVKEDELKLPTTEAMKPLMEEIVKRQFDDVSNAVELVEKYAREFHWQTGSRDTRELVLWLKERALASKE